jgi:hypothetical protein
MSDNIEGSVILDGLLEGRFAGGAFTAADLRQWARKAARRNLHFSIETDGDSFSVLGERREVSAGEIGDDPARAIAEALGELLADMPHPTRASAMSTLRSVEYRKGEEVQTLYVLAPGGAVEVKQRVVDARTTAPMQPLTRGQKVRMALTGLGVALLVFLASSVFVDYRSMFSRIVDNLLPPSAADVAVDAGAYGECFTVAKKELAGGGKALVLTLKRGKAFPLTDQDIQRLFDQAKDVPSRLLADSLARGYVRCECFDKDGKFLYFSMLRISGLRKDQTLEVPVPLPADGVRVAKLAFTN